MHRQPLLKLLSAHQPFDATETAMLERIVQFVSDNPQCFERSLLCGHVTGAAWVLNMASSHALLIHHVKLDRWLQPGGHCDGDADVLRVAMREAHEETGLTSLQAVSPDIFDLDVHWIPMRGAGNEFIPGHWHYDVRFLLRIAEEEPFRKNQEVKDLRWVELREIAEFNDESLRRMALKSLLSR